jgi:hypothetical protein
MRVQSRSTTIRGSAVLLGFLAGPALLSAQKPVSPAPPAAPRAATRVRMKLLGVPSPIIGSFVAATADSISFVLNPNGLAPRATETPDTATIARGIVQTFEVSSGRHHHVLRAVAWGLGSGIGVGAVAGAASYSPCHETGFLACFLEPRSRGEAAVWGAAVGAALGTASGLVIGALYRSDDWQQVSMDRVAQLRIVPTTRGVSVSLALPFD